MEWIMPTDRMIGMTIRSSGQSRDKDQGANGPPVYPCQPNNLPVHDISVTRTAALGRRVEGE
ncbi:hypothetical protein [Streptomyces montanisoli]|uniref:Uncharacterized protein n=1 Tax=Streptomyces montanisoli TaxID=2798581 RepID=A0A940MJF1_9ACTN|nr:hypothetical protein [Streptomyces montanisoli]MBP0461306.1 hypothetical protein [Streptomyces montanisoli]